MESMLKIMAKITSKYLRNKPIRFRAGYEVRDLIQSALIGVLEGIRKFDPAEGVPAKAWLMMVAERKIRTDLRDQNRDKRRINLFATSLSVPVGIFADDDQTLEDILCSDVNVSDQVVGELTEAEMLYKLKLLLTAFEYRVLQLLYLGYSGPEIVQKLEIRYKAFDNAQQRIRKKARKLFGGTS